MPRGRAARRDHAEAGRSCRRSRARECPDRGGEGEDRRETAGGAATDGCALGTLPPRPRRAAGLHWRRRGQITGRMNDADLFERLAAALRERRSVALLTVVATKGSVPRREGARMIVGADGATEGTIG